MFGPDGRERAEAARGFDVTNDTDDDHRRSLDDGDGFDDFLLVHLGARTFEISNDVGHAGLVAHEGCQVDGFLGVVPGEGLHLSAVTSCALPGQEAKRTVPLLFARVNSGSISHKQDLNKPDVRTFGETLRTKQKQKRPVERSGKSSELRKQAIASRQVKRTGCPTKEWEASQGRKIYLQVLEATAHEKK